MDLGLFLFIFIFVFVFDIVGVRKAVLIFALGRRF